LSIPWKRHARPMLGFLSQEEVQAILNATDNSRTGRRDRLLFQLLYNTGARVSELTAVRERLNNRFLGKSLRFGWSAG
jgi:site-specific recombinase XerD